MEYSRNILRSHNRRLKNAFNAIIFTFILGSVSACGSNFFYSLIDNIIIGSLDQYFALNKEQKRFLKGRLAYKLNLHRTHGIPEHIAFIKGIQERIQKGLDQETFKWFIQETTRQSDLIINLFSDDLVEFLMTLQTEQVDYFERKLTEENEEYQEQLKNLSDKQPENNPEKTIKSFEEWFGPLSDTQKTEILKLVQEMQDNSRQQDNSKQSYSERLERQQKFINVLRCEPKNREELEKALYETINPARISLEDGSTVLLMEFVIKIDQLITPEQRNHLIKKLDGWIDKLETLMDPS